MAYTNSPLVNVTLLSPNHSGQRIHTIDTITIHCVVGQCTAKRIGEIFQPTSRQASSNYGVGLDGSIGLYVEEKNRSWCSSSNANDQRAITIEVASDTKEPYAVTEKQVKEKKERQERLRYEKTKAKMAAWAAKTNTQLAIRAGKEVDGG